MRMPENLVSVIPDKTLEPILLNASLDRSWYVPSALQNARTICDTNSTPIPIHYAIKLNYYACSWQNYLTKNLAQVLTTTKLTTDIAFSEIFQSHIIPPILTTISDTMNKMINAAMKSKPVNKNDTAKIVANEMPSKNDASLHIVRYCS